MEESEVFAEVQPLCIFLAVKGTKGDRLLFKYPYEDDSIVAPPLSRVSSTAAFTSGNRGTTGMPVATSSVVPRQERVIPKLSEDDPWVPPVYNTNESLIDNGRLVGLTDEILGYLFAVRPGVCGQPLEVKINDVRFVCFPTLLQQPGAANAPGDLPTLLLFNIIFALRATTRRSFVQCYQDLSKRLAIALRHEESRCRYLSKQTRIMAECMEEAINLPEACQESPFKLMLPKSELAQDLKTAFVDVTTTGFVNVKINRWIEVSYCLPHKVHWVPGLGIFEPEKLQRLLSAMRPYHGMLLLCDQKELVDCAPIDGSPTLSRLLNVYTPLRSFQTLSFESGIPLSQVMRLAEHLVYWGKALIIYPLCETNVYSISPLAQMHSKQLATEFSKTFPKYNFLVTLSEFSSPISLSEFTSPLSHEPHQQTERVKMVVWFLRYRLIMQLHTYVYLILDDGRELMEAKIEDDEQEDDGRRAIDEKSVGEKPINGKSSSTDQSITDKSTAGATIEVHPIADLSIADQSDRSTGDSPDTDQSLIEHSATGESIGGPATQKKSTTEQPIVKKSTSDQPPVAKSTSIESPLSTTIDSPITDKSILDQISSPSTPDKLEIRQGQMENEDWRKLLDRPEANLLAKLPDEFQNSSKNSDDQNDDGDLRLFLKLASRYFNGRHHFEDIMYWENFRRSDLVRIVAKFQSFLATCQHEDELCSVFLEQLNEESFAWAK